jgi:hypothetical protein
MWWLLLVPVGAIALLYAAVLIEARFHPHKPSRYSIEDWRRRHDQPEDPESKRYRDWSCGPIE